MSKRYGVDGPPQLAGRTRPVSAEERLACQASRLGRDPDDWLRKVVCDCSRDDDFRVLTTDPFTPVKVRDGAEITSGAVRLELACQACNTAFTVFDDQLNGWNAVVVGDKNSLPPDYVDRVREILRLENCENCRSPRFGCVVWFCYDSDADDLPDDESEWDEAFGAFAAWSVCSRCGRAREAGQAPAQSAAWS